MAEITEQDYAEDPGRDYRAERDAARAELARAQEILGIGDVLKR